MSLEIRSDNVGIAEILSQADFFEISGDVDRDELSGLRTELMDRLAETRSSLATGQNGYVPTLELGEDGEIDLTG